MSPLAVLQPLSLHCTCENDQVVKMTASDVFHRAVYNINGNYTGGRPFYFNTPYRYPSHRT